MHIARPWKILLLLLSVFVETPAYADIVFAAPPREGSAKGSESSYEPIARFLAKVTGDKVVFSNPDNWLTYQSEMRKGAYDIVFDGPAFNGWRMANLQHVPLVKLPGKLSFVVVVKKDDTHINTIDNLVGRTVCGFAPPNLATLTVQYEFPNPARQPLIISTTTFKESYEGVIKGKCVAAVVQAKMFAKLDAQAQAARVIFTSKPLPNQALSAGPKVPAAMRAKIIQAMLSPEGRQATQAVLDRFNAPEWQPAVPEEYQGLQVLLRDVWGFGL